MDHLETQISRKIHLKKGLFFHLFSWFFIEAVTLIYSGKTKDDASWNQRILRKSALRRVSTDSSGGYQTASWFYVLWLSWKANTSSHIRRVSKDEYCRRRETKRMILWLITQISSLSLTLCRYYHTQILVASSSVSSVVKKSWRNY